MKIALLTQYLPTPHEDYTRLAELTIPVRDEYCARHGYQHIIQKGVYMNPAMYYAYDRLLLLRDLMEQNVADVFWVLNVQAVITNLAKPIAEVVDDQRDFWVSRDCHDVNMGSFLVRNSPGGREWIDFIISLEPQYRNDGWHEQRATIHNVDNPRFKDRISIVPQGQINSYLYSRLYHPWGPDTPGEWRKGDLVISLPGLNLQQRLDLVNEILKGDYIVR